VVKELNKKVATENAIITQADKEKTVVIIYSKGYSDKIQSFLTANNFNTLAKSPAEKFQKLIHKTKQSIQPKWTQERSSLKSKLTWEQW